MAENSANGYSSGELPSGSGSSIPPMEQIKKHVASESEVSVGDNSESTTYISDHPSDVPSAERNYVASKSTISTFCHLVGTRMQANYVFQSLGLTVAIVFGIYGYNISRKALQQNRIANELALLNLCASGGSMSAVSEACSRVPLGPALANIASELSPNTQQVTDTVNVTKGSNIEEDFIQPPESTVTTTVSLPSYEEPMITPPDFTVTTELTVTSTPTDTVPIMATASVVSSLTDSFDLPQSTSPSDPIISSPSTSISISAETKTSHLRTIPLVGGVLLALLVVCLAAAFWRLWRRRHRAYLYDPPMVYHAVLSRRRYDYTPLEVVALAIAFLASKMDNSQPGYSTQLVLSIVVVLLLVAHLILEADTSIL